MNRSVAFIAAAIAAACVVAPASAQTPSRVIRLIDQRCANCHRMADSGRAPDVDGAPDLAALPTMTPQTILQAMTAGAMRVHVEDLPDDTKRAMAEFISGRKLGPLAAGDARSMSNQCRGRGAASTPGIPGTSGTTSEWNGWSPSPDNARFQRAPGFSAADVPRLALKWAFGSPGASSVYGQPTVAGGRVFVAVDTGYVYALDAATGCVHWSFCAGGEFMAPGSYIGPSVNIGNPLKRNSR